MLVDGASGDMWMGMMMGLNAVRDREGRMDREGGMEVEGERICSSHTFLADTMRFNHCDIV